MARSNKKPFEKQKKKRKYNKAFRSINKTRINQDEDPLLLNEVVNKYDICDWRTKLPKGEDKSYRK